MILAIKDSYTKILLNFNDSVTYDECEDNIWKESENVTLEEILFPVPVAYFNGSGVLSLESGEELPCDSSITYELWIYLIEGHFGFSSDRAYRGDTVCLCIGDEGIGYDTGITSYYPGQYVVAGSRETRLLSLNEWHYITLSVDKGKNHYISIDGNIVYSGFNSRDYSLSFLPMQLGSVPTWAYGRSNSFSFKGYIKGFRISSGIARYKNNFKCPTFPNAPNQEVAVNISIPNSEKSGSYKGKNEITYYYRVSFSKVSNNEALISVNYGKSSKEIKNSFSSISTTFNFDNYMNSEAILLSKANSEINKLKEYLNEIIDEIILPEESVIEYISDTTGIRYYLKQSLFTVDNAISSCRIVVNTFYSKDLTSFNNKYSQKVIRVNSENYSQYNSELLNLMESEINTCEFFLDTLIDTNILVPNTVYKNILAKNGDTYYLRLVYTLGLVTDTLAIINFKTTWGDTAEFKFTFSSKTFYIDASNYSFYYSLLSRLGNSELLDCAKMFENISNSKIIIRIEKNTKIKNIVTYSNTEINNKYQELISSKGQRLFCKVLNEEEKANTENLLDLSILAFRKNKDIFYIKNSF